MQQQISYCQLSVFLKFDAKISIEVNYHTFKTSRVQIKITDKLKTLTMFILIILSSQLCDVTS